MLVIGILAYFFNLWRQWNLNAQPQEDPKVANVWRIATTYGAVHHVQRGSNFQKWLNERNIHLFGTFQEFTSQTDYPSSVAFWFDYSSHIPGIKELECHRAGVAAFEDDLGNRYHGFLEFQGRIVGVILPGYDHSAKKIICKIQWMPRQPAHPVPKSIPMTFTMDLPQKKRLLPSYDTLPTAPIVVEKEGVRVHLSDVKMTLASLTLKGIALPRASISFKMKIDNGVHVGYNMATLNAPEMVFSPQTIPGATTVDILKDGKIVRAEPEDSFRILDPYGIDLLRPQDALEPDASTNPTDVEKPGRTIRWSVQVDNVGKSTDVLRFQFPVQKITVGNSKPNQTILFDILVPVRASNQKSQSPQGVNR